MFSAANGKIKLPPEDAVLVTSPLRCLLNGPFRDLHFNVSDHRIIPVHDVVFLDDFERNVKPLIYRPVTSEVAVADSANVDVDATPAEKQQRSFSSISR
ncbi:hypothetical protein M5D96_010985 [Drosophila gunungcola]|uniref:Uncharacterized protein n=1 Tax=Drosophila gunungcola TaxID=103775 RepID=A0A9Q0BLL9_9MUSC|nr:hypothetical protein M5D96_010985 [Drosophila gunungcola]